MYVCNLGLCALCAKHLDPSFSLVPSKRATSKSRHNKQGCSMLYKSHGPDALESRSGTAADSV